MAVAIDGRIAFRPAGQLHGTVALSGKRNWSIIKFCNGDFMGEKLNCRKLQQRHLENGIARAPVSMSLTADIVRDTKVSVRGPCSPKQLNKPFSVKEDVSFLRQLAISS